MAGLKKYSVTLAGHRTSITLEPIFWQQLQLIAADRNISLTQLIREIDSTRTREAGESAKNLSSAIRVYITEQLLKLR